MKLSDILPLIQLIFGLGIGIGTAFALFFGLKGIYRKEVVTTLKATADAFERSANQVKEEIATLKGQMVIVNEKLAECEQRSDDLERLNRKLQLEIEKRDLILNAREKTITDLTAHMHRRESQHEIEKNMILLAYRQQTGKDLIG